MITIAMYTLNVAHPGFWLRPAVAARAGAPSKSEEAGAGWEETSVANA